MQPVLDSMPSFNWTEFQDRHGISMPDMFRKEEKPRPGIKLRDLGYKPKHPIIIVPGFVTSGLELWHGKPCANRFFRYDAQQDQEQGGLYLTESESPICRPF